MTCFAFGVLLNGCANAKDGDSAYAYEMVELQTNGSSIEEPLRPYKELWEATTLRAEQEVLKQSNVSKAYRGSTYFGRHSDSYFVYAITPERGVFYYLPPGPYDPKSNTVLALPEKIEACRLEIEWAKLEKHPYLDGMASIRFVSRDCQPFPPEDFWVEEIEVGQQFEVEPSELTGKKPANLVTSSMRSGAFDVPNAIARVMKEDGRKLDRTIPLAGINEKNLVAGIANDGSVYLSLESTWLSYKQRCIFNVGTWEKLAETALLRDAESTCSRIARQR